MSLPRLLKLLQSTCKQKLARGSCWRQAMGDKLQARRLAEECGVPCVPGTEQAVAQAADARAFVEAVGLPVILKAAMGVRSPA